MPENIHTAAAVETPGTRPDETVVLYDGDCPFCARYVQMTRLRDAVGKVRLLDARDRPDLVSRLRDDGYEINDGMAVWHRGVLYFGADAMHLISLLTGRSGALNRVMAAVLGDRGRARALYPALRRGRAATLRLLGRRPIG